MKKSILFFVGLIALSSCNSFTQKEKPYSISEVVGDNYKSYGGEVASVAVYDKSMMIEKYKTLQNGDTIDITFSSTVNGVCKAKGCWMKLALEDGQETMVKFKDYGFFVPKDIEKDTVIVQGKAFVNEMSVEEQRHFASDAGKSEEEIAAITTPKKTYSFVADGVLIRN